MRSIEGAESGAKIGDRRRISISATGNPRDAVDACEQRPCERARDGQENAARDRRPAGSEDGDQERRQDRADRQPAHDRSFEHPEHPRQHVLRHHSLEERAAGDVHEGPAATRDSEEDGDADGLRGECHEDDGEAPKTDPEGDHRREASPAHQRDSGDRPDHAAESERRVQIAHPDVPSPRTSSATTTIKTSSAPQTSVWIPPRPTRKLAPGRRQARGSRRTPASPDRARVRAHGSGSAAAGCRTHRWLRPTGRSP